MRLFRNGYFYLTVFGIILAIFLFVKSCVIPVGQGISERSLSKEETVKKRKAATIEYLQLFSADVREHLKFDGSYITKSKHPCIFFDSKDKAIGVFKIEQPNDIPLSQFLELKQKNEKETPDVVYQGFEFANVKFGYSSEYDSIVKKAYLLYDDGLSKMTKLGDSIVAYNFSVVNLCIRYEENGTNDIVFSSEKSGLMKSRTQRQNMSVMLFKKNKIVYFIIAYPYQNDAGIDNLPLQLLNLGDKKKV